MAKAYQGLERSSYWMLAHHKSAQQRKATGKYIIFILHSAELVSSCVLESEKQFSPNHTLHSIFLMFFVTEYFFRKWYNEHKITEVLISIEFYGHPL